MDKASSIRHGRTVVLTHTSLFSGTNWAISCCPAAAFASRCQLQFIWHFSWSVQSTVKANNVGFGEKLKVCIVALYCDLGIILNFRKVYLIMSQIQRRLPLWLIIQMVTMTIFFCCIISFVCGFLGDWLSPMQALGRLSRYGRSIRTQQQSLI